MKLIYTSKICLFFILICISFSCEKSIDLHIDENEGYYAINNQLALSRFKSIMYNENDTNQIYERFKIVHVSDPHLSKYSISNNASLPINLIQSVDFANQSELRINAMTVTGDFISNGKKSDAISYLNSFKNYIFQNNWIPTLLCNGNHDCNYKENEPDYFINKDEINRILYPETNNYYYRDIANPQGGKIRFIALDMLDQSELQYNTLFYTYYSQEQINWFGEIALKENLSDNDHIIILNHYPFAPYSSGNETLLCDGDYIYSWKMIPEIIEAYRNKTIINKSYVNKLIDTDTLQVQFDFGTRAGNFICYLGGHDHCTMNFSIYDIENVNDRIIPQQMLLCTNQAPSEVGKIYNTVQRRENDLTSNSFCLYAIDTKKREIYITYFGAYKPNNKIDYPEIETIFY